MADRLTWTRYIRRIRRTFHISLMPRGYFGCYIWIGADDFGDFVIWIWRLWIGVSWRDCHWPADLRIRESPNG